MPTPRKTAPAPAPPAGWTVSTDVQLPGRPALSPGVELSIKVPGKYRRRCRFMRHVRTDEGLEWVDVFDGKAVRSFALELVDTVHTGRKMPARP